MSGDLLFVYGTLLRRIGHEMHRVLARGAEPLGGAVFQGRLYAVRHYPGAVASRDPADQVHGEVYRLEDPARVFTVLDAYEGRAFERREARVVLASGAAVRAWIYVYGKPTRGLERIASGDFRLNPPAP